MTDWLTVNAALRPHYVRNKESPVFLRKISLKIASRLAIKIETFSGACNTCFWYAVAPAVRNTSLGSASWRISYRRCSSVSKTRIACARDRFYIFTLYCAESGVIGPWHCWLTIDFQCCDSVGWVDHLTHKIIPEMTYNVSNRTLNRTVLYCTCNKRSQKWPIMCQTGR